MSLSFQKAELKKKKKPIVEEKLFQLMNKTSFHIISRLNIFLIKKHQLNY